MPIVKLEFTSAGIIGIMHTASVPNARIVTIGIFVLIISNIKIIMRKKRMRGSPDNVVMDNGYIITVNIFKVIPLLM